MDTATCIVGIIDNGKVWIGGDSLGSYKETLQIWAISNEKVFTRKDEAGVEWVFGFTSNYRFGQIVQYELVLKGFDTQAEADPMAYMVKTLVPNLKGALERCGYPLTDPKQQGVFLAGVKGNLFRIGGDLGVTSYQNGYVAVGCGDAIAHGALYATEGKNPEERITIALNAATEFSGGVRGPFVIKSI